MNRKRRSPDRNELSLGDLLYWLMRKKWLILLVTAAAAVGGYFYAYATHIPQYTTTATMVFNVTQQSSNPLNTADTLRLVDTFSEIVKSNRVAEQVCDALDLTLSAEEVKSFVSVSVMENTPLVKIQVTTTDPMLSYNIAQQMMIYSPQVINETLKTGSVNVLDQPKEPTAPIPFAPLKNILIFAVVAFLVMCLGVVVYSLVFTKVKNARDVEQNFDSEVIGEIPHVKGRDKKRAHLITDNDMPDSFLEAYASYSIILMRELERLQTKRFMITSTHQAEGKSTVAINTAMSLVKAGKRVLLLDVDLKRPTVYRRIAPEKTAIDIHSLIEKKVPAQSAILKTDCGFDILPCTYPTKESSNLLSLINFDELLKEVEAQYDYIIFDTPPVGIISDAMLLMKYVNTVVFVIKQEESTIRMIADTVERLDKAGAEIVGMVLNDIRHHNLGSGYSYKYGYAYHYKYARYYSDMDKAKKDDHN